MLRRLLERPAVYWLTQKLFDVRPVVRAVIDEVRYVPGMRVLDIGCGVGHMAEYFRPEDYVGIDVSEEYIAFARANRGGSFHAMSGERVDELSGQFDRVFMVGVFHHMSDIQVRQTLDALSRVMSCGGYFFVLEAVWPPGWWDLPGYVLRRMDRGKFVRTTDQWRTLLGGRWTLEKPRVWRNGLLTYFDCVLVPPRDPNGGLAVARADSEGSTQ